MKLFLWGSDFFALAHDLQEAKRLILEQVGFNIGVWRLLDSVEPEVKDEPYGHVIFRGVTNDLASGSPVEASQ
jgi:hypothetical protein